MTDMNSAAVTEGPRTESGAAEHDDSRVAEIRRQREDAQRAGDRDTAQMLDEMEREVYAAEERENRTGTATEDSFGSAAAAEGDHTPLTHDEVSGVFGVLDAVDPQAAASLRREWGDDAGANLGYAHLWFTTQYTEPERDSMVVTPGLVSMAARMGRTLAAGGGVADSPTEPHEIRRLKEEAQRKGDYRLAQQYDEQERVAYARIHGAGPIVGRGLRNL